MRRNLVTRIVLGALFAVLNTACISAPVATMPEDPETIVFVHGAWGGGWQFKKVEPMLEAKGWDVYRPTLTGLGERVHLAGPEVDLSTHIEDIVNILEFGELDDIVLVGHSYGGMVITGVADRVPDRIARLVYMDAILPVDGESVADLFGGALDSMATAGAGGAEPWQLVPNWVEPGEEPPVDVPQPIRTFTQPIELSNPDATPVPAAYILTVEAGKDTDEFDIFADRARGRGWRVVEMEGGHNPQWFQPEALVEVLLSVVRK